MKRYVAMLLLVCLLLAGCTAKAPEIDIDFHAVMSSIESDVGLVEHMADMTASDIELLYGIQGSEITQYAGKYNDSGVLADEIIMLEAVDEAAAAVLKERVQQRYDRKAAESKDYLPEEYSKITACEVTQNGRFVSMFISSDAQAMRAIYDKAF